MTTNAPSPKPSLEVVAIVLLAAPVICTVVAAVHLPAPQAVSEARANVDRSSLEGIVLKKPPSPSIKLDAELDDSLQLVGADLPQAPLSAGRSFEFKTYWKVKKSMFRSWRMFVHVDLKGGRFRMHGDHWPVTGKYGTDKWQEGEYVVDVHKMRVPLDAPKGKYDVFVGYYIDDERMRFTGGDARVHTGDNRLKLGTVRVE